MVEIKNYSKVFSHHGIELSHNLTEKEQKTDCPFCGQGGKLAINKVKSTWRCFTCDSKGNMYGFLTKWHEHCLAQTTDEHYAEFGKHRGLDPEILSQFELAYDKTNNCWLVPVYKINEHGKRTLINLKTFRVYQDGTKEFFGTPYCSQGLFNQPALHDNHSPVFICEGEWDAMALLSCDLSEFNNAVVVAVPGANSFKDEWVEMFAGRSVYLLYDNDDAGPSGIRIATEKLSSASILPSVYALAWPEGSPKDIRDYVVANGPGATVEMLKDNLHEVLLDNPERVQRDSWDQVIGDFKKLYHVDYSFADAATVVAATLLSGKLPGDPLWVFLVGPPSTSKTTICDAFAFDQQHCESLSKLTSKALISGWKVPGTDDDVSIFPLLKNRTLLIKDYTAVMSMGAGVQEELYGILRDCYDGRVKVTYGNGKVCDYDDVYFSLVAAVTDEIRRDNRSALGERFLKCEVIGEDYDPMALTLAALNSVVKDATRTRNLQLLGCSIRNYLNGLYINPNNLPVLPEKYRKSLSALSLVIGYLRATVGKVADDLQFRSRPEGGGRVVKQLSKLGLCLCLLLKKPEFDREVYRLVKKVALDTIKSFQLEVAQLLSANPKGLTTAMIQHRLQLPKTTTQRIVGDLQALSVIYRRKVSNKHGGGRDEDSWQLTPNFLKFWNDAELTPKKSKKANA